MASNDFCTIFNMSLFGLVEQGYLDITARLAMMT